MRIICWHTNWWESSEHARRWESHPHYSLKAWSDRAEYLFKPVAKVIACGTYSDPSFCPVGGLTIVNSGVIRTGHNHGNFRHYCRCAFTAMMAWALNRGGWDLLVHWDNDALLGDIDFDKLLKDFWASHKTFCAPMYRDSPSGPLIIMKHEAAQRWLHYRTTPNMVDSGSPPIPLGIEQEFLKLYERRWYNPWNTKLGYIDEPFRTPDPSVEGWPMVAWLRERDVEPYAKTQCPKTKPYMHGVLTHGLSAEPIMPRIMVFTTAYWDKDHPHPKTGSYSEYGPYALWRWVERMKFLFSPVEIFLSCGTWSDPKDCPVKGIKVINSGATRTGVYDGRRRHYGKCAMTAAMAYALNRDDWDILVSSDPDGLIGDIDFQTLLREFMQRPEIFLAPGWHGNPGGPTHFFKREAASRMLHQRITPSIRDDDEADEELLFEQEWAHIFRGGRWWNPWPQFLEFTANGRDDLEMLKWPMVRQPGNILTPKYIATQVPKALPAHPLQEIKPIGQILPGSPFGSVLTELAWNAETIVETGTWFGGGSTRCLSMGLHNHTQRMWTLERDPAMHREAKKLYNDDRITFLHGSAVPILNATDVPVVFNELPVSIDLLLIDSGEYEGREELKFLGPCAKVVAMDDTRNDKNRDNREELLKSADWKVIHDNQEDRNGWAVFERV